MLDARERRRLRAQLGVSSAALAAAVGADARARSRALADAETWARVRTWARRCRADGTASALLLLTATLHLAWTLCTAPELWALFFVGYGLGFVCVGWNDALRLLISLFDRLADGITVLLHALGDAAAAVGRVAATGCSALDLRLGSEGCVHVNLGPLHVGGCAIPALDVPFGAPLCPLARDFAEAASALNISDAQLLPFLDVVAQAECPGTRVGVGARGFMFIVRLVCDAGARAFLDAGGDAIVAGVATGLAAAALALWALEVWRVLRDGGAAIVLAWLRRLVPALETPRARARRMTLAAEACARVVLVAARGAAALGPLPPPAPPEADAPPRDAAADAPAVRAATDAFVWLGCAVGAGTLCALALFAPLRALVRLCAWAFTNAANGEAAWRDVLCEAVCFGDVLYFMAILAIALHALAAYRDALLRALALLHSLACLLGSAVVWCLA